MSCWPAGTLATGFCNIFGLRDTVPDLWRVAAFRIPWFDDAVVTVLRQNRVKKSGHTFSGTQIHAPEKVCHKRWFIGSCQNQ